jgi:nitrate reductase gamma subunit
MQKKLGLFAAFPLGRMSLPGYLWAAGLMGLYCGVVFRDRACRCDLASDILGILFYLCICLLGGHMRSIRSNAHPSMGWWGLGAVEARIGVLQVVRGLMLIDNNTACLAGSDHLLSR